MHIKIYTMNQLLLLRKLNKVMDKYSLPREIIKKTEKLLYEKQLGKYGFVLIFMKPIQDDITDIFDALDCYPNSIRLSDELVGLEIKKTKSRMVKGKEWYRDKLIIRGKRKDSYIWVFYSMRTKDIYDREVR